jgi:hypothetical protein
VHVTGGLWWDKRGRARTQLQLAGMPSTARASGPDDHFATKRSAPAPAARVNVSLNKVARFKDAPSAAARLAPPNRQDWHSALAVVEASASATLAEKVSHAAGARLHTPRAAAPEIDLPKRPWSHGIPEGRTCSDGTGRRRLLQYTGPSSGPRREDEARVSW